MRRLLTERYRERLAGVLSCCDRIIVTGTLPGACYAKGMTGFLSARQIRIFDYPRFAEPLRNRVRERAAELAPFPPKGGAGMMVSGFSLLFLTGGTEGSNPAPSSVESSANLTPTRERATEPASRAVLRMPLAFAGHRCIPRSHDRSGCPGKRREDRDGPHRPSA